MKTERWEGDANHISGVLILQLITEFEVLGAPGGAPAPTAPRAPFNEAGTIEVEEDSQMTHAVPPGRSGDPVEFDPANETQLLDETQPLDLDDEFNLQLAIMASANATFDCLRVAMASHG